VVIVSTAANLLVLLSYKFEKKLRTTFAILVGNLAVTDLIVSAFPMFFFTINILLGFGAFCHSLLTDLFTEMLKSRAQTRLETNILSSVSIPNIWAWRLGQNFGLDFDLEAKVPVSVIIIFAYSIQFQV